MLKIGAVGYAPYVVTVFEGIKKQRYQKAFECDQNLWDAVGLDIGGRPGVESHRTLEDHR
jgi:hypothetical protein